MKPGKYVARATAHRFDASQKTGTECICVTLEVAGDPFDGTADESIEWVGWLTEKSTPRVIRDLKTMGWDCVSFAEMAGLGDEQVEIVVEEEEFNGRTSPRVRYVNSLKKRDSGAGKSLDAKYAGLLMEARRK